MTREQLKQLFIINSVPFVGFGFLDNVIMIVAGEYIDQVCAKIRPLKTFALSLSYYFFL